MTPSYRSAGIALLITLLVVTLLTIVVVEFTYSTNVNAHLTRNSLSSLQARYLARGAVALGEILLELDLAAKNKNPPERPNAETLLDPWAQPSPPRPIGEGVGEAGFRIDDESARFNINSLMLRPGIGPSTIEARKTMFQGLLAALGLDINLLFPLLDWLDADDEVTGKNGAEREFYRALTPPYEPRNGRILTFEELALVRGFSGLTREQWAELRSIATVLPTDELLINVNTAAELLLTAMLGAVDDAAAAKAIVSQRQQHPFLDVGELNAIPGWRQLPQQVRTVFGIHSTHFMIHAVGVAADVTRGVAVLERRNGLRFDPIDWHEEPGAILNVTGPSQEVGVLRPSRH